MERIQGNTCAGENHSAAVLCVELPEKTTQCASDNVVYLPDTGATNLTSKVCQKHRLRTVLHDCAEDNLFPRKGLSACFVVGIPYQVDTERVSQLVKNLSRRHPVVAVFGSPNSKTAFALGRAGALKLIELPGEETEFLATINEAWELDAIWHPSRRDVSEGFQTLTRRERQVLRGLLLGKVNKQLACDYGVSPKTIEYHRANLMQKLRVTSVAELVRVSLEAGFQ